MKKSASRRKKQKSTPIIPILILMLALIGITLYIAVHFREASSKGNISDKTAAALAYTEKAETPVPTVQPEPTPEPTPSETLPVILEASSPEEAASGTPSEATVSQATALEPILEVPLAEEDKPVLQVYFMAVGRNDGILLRMGDECAFIDGGMNSNVRDALEYISDTLGVKKLKYYIATHGHEDHVGCAGLVLSTFETETILYNSNLSIQTMMETAKTNEARKIIDSTEKQLFLLNDTVTLGDAVLTCVGPQKVVPRRDRKDFTENENSIIIRLTYGNHSFLLTGDATTDEFLELLKMHPEYVPCDVIKGAHHDNPINKDFLNATKAKYYVYSTGHDFPPESWDINRVRETGARVFVTSSNNAGTTLFTTDGEELTVQVENTAPYWKLDREKLRLSVGKTARCTYSAGRRIIDTIQWTTSDDSIVRIEYGVNRVKIHALAPGKCTVTATHFDGSTKEIIVEVKK